MGLKVCCSIKKKYIENCEISVLVSITEILFVTTLQKYFFKFLHSKKILGCFNPNLGQIWNNLNVGLKM